MTRTTKAQRLALKRLWQRKTREGSPNEATTTYRQFRRMVHPTIGCDNAIVVPLFGMWLAIEADGYTHS